MKLELSTQISERDLRSSPVDLAICASGYENRATHLARRLKSLRIAKKVAFGFTDRKQLSREANDRWFERLGFELVDASGDDASPLLRVLKYELERAGRSTLKVLVDYSCMTRIWYASIIDLLRGDPSDGRVEIVFAYSPSTFMEPGFVSTNSFIGPVRGFCQLDLPTRDTALIVGLGYERERALGLVDYIEPKETYAFYTDPALEPQFVRVVQRNNAELMARLRKAGHGYVVSHPLADLENTMRLLASVCSQLATRYRVILAPLGVKPFSLLCLLLATQFSSVDVWRVSVGPHGEPVDRSPLGPLLFFSAAFAPSKSGAKRKG